MSQTEHYTCPLCGHPYAIKGNHACPPQRRVVDLASTAYERIAKVEARPDTRPEGADPLFKNRVPLIVSELLSPDTSFERANELLDQLLKETAKWR